MSGLTRPRSLLLAACLAAVAAALAVTAPGLPLRGEVGDAEASPADAISIEADYAQQWTAPREGPAVEAPPPAPLLERGQSILPFASNSEPPPDDVYLFRGRCRLAQGDTTLQADKMVVWRRPDADGRSRLVVYLEDNVRLERPGQSRHETSMFINLATDREVAVAAPHRIQDQPATCDAVYQRAIARRQSSRRASLRPTQLVVPGGPAPAPGMRVEGPAAGVRRVRIFSRSAVPFNIQTFPSPDTIPPEQIWVLTGGINVLVDNMQDLGTVDLSADNMVIWTRTAEGEEFQSEQLQSRDTPFTVYLEGNIVIRQGPHVIRACRAVYDAREDRALMLDADLRTHVPQIGGDLRVRAERIRQLSENNFHAQNAWTTASQYGRPGYRLQATDVFVDQRVLEPIFGFGSGQVDPLTGLPLGEPIPWVTSLNNTFYVGDAPVFYLPRISAPAEDPRIPIRNVQVGYDRIFGAQVKVTWDLFELLGQDDPPGTRWDLLTDYYGERGPAVGTGGVYRGTDLFDVPGPYYGQGLAYYVRDDGLDRLGTERRDLPLDTNDRYRLMLRHKQLLEPYNTEVRAELGVQSDRNFLEQYFESEWDGGKDQETLIYGKWQDENQALTGLVRTQLNEFENDTEWYPRLDHFLLGESVLGDVFSYYTHSQVAYGRLRRGEPPELPNDVYTPIPYITDAEGAVLSTRHELDAPFSLGPIRLVPYALGEGSYWGEDFEGDEIGRLYGELGLRSSLGFWRVFPDVQSRLFNLNGLAHKVLWELEGYTARASEDLDGIPQYHEIDDDAQERFRQRFPIQTFGGIVPFQLDPRRYAVRAGAGHWISAPYYELVDDLDVIRLALRQRLQTKVGPPERTRIRDWMTLDLEASFFPNEDRDNFGESYGLLGGRYIWAISDRTNIIANAMFDPFENGQRQWDVGFTTQRSPRGSLALTFAQVQAATIESQFVSASYSYLMSPKYMSSLVTSYDLGEDRNIGQSLVITRIGADFVFHAGVNYDAGKDNAGIALAVEPRIGNVTGLVGSPLSFMNGNSPR